MGGIYMQENGTIFYLHNDADFMAFVERYTRKIISLSYPITEIKRGQVLERGYKLDEGKSYLIYENGLRKYCYIENEELIHF